MLRNSRIFDCSADGRDRTCDLALTCPHTNVSLWRRQGSNLRPSAYETLALPLSYAAIFKNIDWCGGEKRSLYH